jgi:hypothetical protein
MRTILKEHNIFLLLRGLFSSVVALFLCRLFLPPEREKAIHESLQSRSFRSCRNWSIISLNNRKTFENLGSFLLGYCREQYISSSRTEGTSVLEIL